MSDQAMEKKAFRTSLGAVWLWGWPQAFECHDTCIVILTGSFSGPTTMRVMADLLPEVPVLISDLPGNHSPLLSAQSMAAYREAYSAAISQLGRPVVLCGLSLGGTVALGCHATNLRAIVALDPVMRTQNASPLWPGFRQALSERPDDRELHDYMWNLFGLGPGITEDRDYFLGTEAREAPAVVLAGSHEGRIPSLLSRDDRVRLKAQPDTRLKTVLGVGHDIGAGATSAIVSTLRELVGS
jgi:pimeloyl-ACP methyl ester carboxylesterase